MKDIDAIEVVADQTAGSRPDEGFLRVRRLVVRNRYPDGSTSAHYECDMVSRKHVDAVAVLLYEITEAGEVRVALKAGVRPPVYFRRDKQFFQPDDRIYRLLPETVAGMLEPEDTGPEGIERRAAAECFEEAGVRVAPADVEPLGGPLFASPGITDEKVFFRSVRARLDDRVEPQGDGSVMEEAGGVIVLSMEDAIARCRDGRIPDAKTEIALLRLRDRLRAEA
ncbi:MAG: NUDIX hydrolase [Planctomycetota bacterium]|nr:NUDIX hydrolase [Planctomycetota bacterium]